MLWTGHFEKLVDRATSNLLMEPDWTANLLICDQIRQNDVQPKVALNVLKKKLISPNPHTAMFAVQLLESMVKNCGSSLHDELTTQPYCELLHELVKTTEHEKVRQKMLELIQAWTHAFRKNPKHNALKDIMNLMKSEGYKFPQMRESDAMFTADSAPIWAEGDVCHRCRIQFTVMVRKHHCRACGQVFCGQCSGKTSTLPKFGIEKEVRVCDACYEQVNKPVTASGLSADMEEYKKSTLAQQNQMPPRKTEEEIREEEEFQLALALSQSEAEAKEKEKMRVTNVLFNYKEPEVLKRPQSERSPSPDDQSNNPELARYLNRSYWENRQSDVCEGSAAASPSAPLKEPSVCSQDEKIRENGVRDVEIEEFVNTLKSQVEIFINRMKSNSSRGRSIANDSSVQTLFMNITAMHSKLLRYIQQHDDSRLYYERLQDKLTQVKDARAALDALREEHGEKLRRQAEEAERQRQMLMAHKLDIMRKKKQEYLQYQRQVALQRIEEQEREMQMRQEQQKHQYNMMKHYMMSSPVHGPQFPPNSAPPSVGYGYQYGGPPSMMVPPMGQPPQSAPPQMQPNMPQHQLPVGYPLQNMPPPNMQQQQPQQQNMPIDLSMMNNMQQGMPPNAGMLPPPGMMQPPPQHAGPMMPYQQPPQAVPPQQQQQPGAPPASPQAAGGQNIKTETQTGELITFD